MAAPRTATDRKFYKGSMPSTALESPMTLG